MNYPVISFNAGELSPQIDARSDVDKYKSGCRRLENMIPKIYGSAERRPGTKYIDTVNGAGRVVSFIYSNSIAYILLLEDYAMYFYYNGARVLDSLGRRLKVDTPYAVGDLPALQFKQSNDVCWIVHPNYPPYKLSRVSANSFSLDAITFTNGPFKKRNDLEVGDGITLTPSVTTGSGTLTAAGGNVFQAGHVGALFRVVQPRAVTSTSGSRTTTGVIGAAILTEGDCTLNIEQGWKGTVRLERSIDAGVSWEVRRSYTSKDGFRAVQFTFTEEEDNIQHRINVTVATSGTFAADLTVNSSTQEGICRVTGVTGQVANMTVLKNFASTGADTRWSEGSWSAVRGYPTTVTFFEDRCIYAGNPHQPQTVWFSATGDYENMDEGTIDDSAFWLTMSSDHRNAILWISALEALIIGTSAGEWRIRSSDYDEPITPTNFSMKEQTTYGSKAIQALPVNDVILFVDSVGRKIREVAYVGDKDKYNAPDLTALAEHITETGIVAIAHQKNPDSILWAVRADGTLLSMTYEREQDVVAWARHLVGPSPVVESSVDLSVDYLKHYPILRELTEAEIPSKPSEPADTALVAATSVTTAVGLQAMAGAGHYSIGADIDLVGVTWTPIANFSGVVEGNGYTISNLSINAPTLSNRGLFTTIGSGCEVRNLNFVSCSVSGKQGNAILAAYADHKVNIKFSDISFTDCSVTGTEGFNACLFGGSVNQHASKLGNVNVWRCSTHNCNITSTETWGGGHSASLIACMGAENGVINIVDCYADGGTITAGCSAGLIYYLSGAPGYPVTIHSCYAAVNFTEGSHPIAQISSGFIDSITDGTIVSCYSGGAITVTTVAKIFDGAGFIGDATAYDVATSIINCYSNTTITVPAGSAGGFIAGVSDGGDFPLTITRCYTTSSITFTSATTGSKRCIGGFLGTAYFHPYSGENGTLLIERCWASGDITIAGVSSNSDRIGGFVGELDINYSSGDPLPTYIIRNCYTWSSIITGANSFEIGGFVGVYNFEPWDEEGHPGFQIQNCYCAQTNSKYGSGLSGQITGGIYDVHGFLGYNYTATNWVVTASYWDEMTSVPVNDVSDDVRTPYHALAKTTGWLMTKSNFETAGWNLTTIWEMADGGTTPGIGAIGTVKSVARIPSTNEDEIWLIVGRTINGAQMQMLEQMQPRNFGDPEDAWFVDCGLSYDGAPEDTFLGLEHLEGEEVVILGDGAVFPRQVVADGQIVLPNTVSKCIIGLPFRYVLKPMRFDILTQHGTTKGSLKKISEVVISFFETSLAKYGIDENNLFEIDWRTDEAYGEPPALFTGDKVVVHEGGFSVEDSIVISGDEPAPCTIRAIVPRIEITGR
jgi:hypothetical protein